jgi:hypothetical protein
MEKKEALARMQRISWLRRKRPNEEFNFKIAFCGFNSISPDSRVKWYAIECRHCLYSSPARKKEKENVDVSKLNPYSSSSSPNQVLTPFLEVERDLSVNIHILMDSHLYSLKERSVWTLKLNSSSLDWKPVTPMNVSRSGARSFTLDSKLYILGGLEGKPVPPTMGWMEVFDPIAQNWEPLPNPPSTTMRSATMICTALKSKEILVIDDFGGARYSHFYTYNLNTRCWKTEQRRSRLLCQYRRPVTVGNTLYWAFLDRTTSRFGSVDMDVGIIQAYDVDADVWYRGFFNIGQLLKKPEFVLTSNENLLPLIHLADQKFCLLLESCTMPKNRHPPEFDTKYVNVLVLDIQPDDDGDDDDDDDDDDEPKLGKQLSVSVESVQKHILVEHILVEDHNCFELLDAVLL